MIKKIFWLAVLVAIIYYGMNYRIDEKPIKEYVVEFYHSPIVQAAVKAGKEAVSEFWEGSGSSNQSPDSGQKEPETPVHGGGGDELTEQDQKALDKVLQKQQR